MLRQVVGISLILTTTIIEEKKKSVSTDERGFRI